MKKYAIALFCLTILSAGCGQLTPEQWAQLTASGASTNRDATNAMITFQSDFKGPVDLLYFANYSSNNQAFTLNVSRFNGGMIAKTVLLRSSDNASLYQLMLDIYSGKVTITSRTTCADCAGSSQIAVTRADGSIVISTYPQLQNTTLAQPLDQLNQYITSRI